MSPFTLDPDARPEPSEPRVMVRLSEYEALKECARTLEFYALMENQDDAFSQHYDRTCLTITDEYGDKTTVMNYPGPPKARAALERLREVRGG